MAKHVEIPFSIVRDHRAVRYLQSSAVGAYWLLVSAALWDGVDLAVQNDASLAMIARQHMTAWKRVRKEVMRALGETMLTVRNEYSRREEARMTLSRNAKKAQLKSLAIATAKRKARNADTELAELTNPLVTLSLPQKAAPWDNRKTDLIARTAAAKRHKSAPPAATLTE